MLQDLPALLDDVGRALETVDPDHAAFLSEARLTVTGAAQVAVQELVEGVERRLAEGSDAPEGESASGGQSALALALFEEAGREQFRRDRPLRSLLLAYQTGVQVAWRHIAAIAVREGVPAEALAALAEGVFRAVDRISAVTTSGFLAEQDESAGMREQMRNALAEHLLSGRSDRAVLERLALQAGWPLPERAAVVLLRCDEQAAATALARLSTRCLQIHSRAWPGVIVPDPGSPGARSRLTTLLRGCPAVVGPALPLAQLPDGAAVAQDAIALLDLAPAGTDPFFVDEHLDAIIVRRDERLLNALRARCLAPLAGAPRNGRVVYEDTLRSWLVHMGDRLAVAADLQVHPQTVRYRLHRLHELFGPKLDDPEERLRLLLVLAWDGHWAAPERTRPEAPSAEAAHRRVRPRRGAPSPARDRHAPAEPLTRA